MQRQLLKENFVSRYLSSTSTQLAWTTSYFIQHTRSLREKWLSRKCQIPRNSFSCQCTCYINTTIMC